MLLTVQVVKRFLGRMDVLYGLTIQDTICADRLIVGRS